MSRNLARAPHPYAKSDAESFLATVDAAGSREHAFAIDLADEGLVGVVGLHVRDGVLLPELGYWLGRAWWGRGLATEAAGAALGWAQTAWGKRGIVASRFRDNAASGRVLEKLGFLYTGEIDHRISPARTGAVETRMMVWLA